jgi:hypothetical protein
MYIGLRKRKTSHAIKPLRHEDLTTTGYHRVGSVEHSTLGAKIIPHSPKIAFFGTALIFLAPTSITPFVFMVLVCPLLTIFFLDLFAKRKNSSHDDVGEYGVPFTELDRQKLVDNFDYCVKFYSQKIKSSELSNTQKEERLADLVNLTNFVTPNMSKKAMLSMIQYMFYNDNENLIYQLRSRWKIKHHEFIKRWMLDWEDDDTPQNNQPYKAFSSIKDLLAEHPEAVRIQLNKENSPTPTDIKPDQAPLSLVNIDINSEHKAVSLIAKELENTPRDKLSLRVNSTLENKVPQIIADMENPVISDETKMLLNDAMGELLRKIQEEKNNIATGHNEDAKIRALSLTRYLND